MDFNSPEMIAMRKALAERTKQSNAAFEAATPQQKRIIIAEDVIKWLHVGKIDARNGTYMGLVTDYGQTSNYAEEDDAREVLLADDAPQCQACALGSLFACAVARLDKLDVELFENAGQGRMHSYLGEFFDSRQLRMIESAFECSDFRPDEDKGHPEERFDSDGRLVSREWVADRDPDFEDAINFGYKADEKYWALIGGDAFYAQSREERARIQQNVGTQPAHRMRIIMENIIKNEGTFKP